MELSRILIRELNDYQLIELREQEGDRSFPIVIGLPEAQEIERRLKGVATKRPLTHQLLASVLNELGATLESVTINDLAEHTFFATLDIRKPSGEIAHIDARPSDAIALAVAAGCPVYAEEHVLEEASQDVETPDASFFEPEEEEDDEDDEGL
ncbi:MAG: bifunctional nuclease family protein [Planctomycetota bacterium]|nr:MAG: bifunctional nuclease family protein [Planctomycetota bacterium]